MFIALSEKQPVVLKYIKNYIALGPVAWIEHLEAPLYKMLAKSGLIKIFHKLRINEFLPANFLTTQGGTLFCHYFNFACKDILR